MTIDDEKSIYVGGIPYDCTESQLRRSFDLYGSVVAVKIINDRGVGGKCYGFVTFKNPRSAMEAISEMDGRTIGGRVVRVNEVKTRGGGGNSSHGREGLRHNQREMAWNKGRSRDRESDYDKDRRRDHSREHDGGRGRRRSHSRDRFQGRDQEQSKDMGEWELRRAHSRNHDRERERDNDLDAIRDRFQGRDREQSRDMGDWELGRAHSRNHDPERERDDDLDAIKDSEFDRVDDRDRRVDKRNDQHTKRLNSSINCDQRSREFSSESSDYQYQVEEQLDMSIKRREELQKEKSDMEQRLEEKKRSIADLQKRSLKLEDLLTSAKKQSSVHQMRLTKLYNCFQQVKEYGDKLKSSEVELQDLVNSVSMEINSGGDLGAKDAYLTNGEL